MKLGHGECDGTCEQGEGDCDRDEDCIPGLICNYDWWFGTDLCQAGKFTQNSEVETRGAMILLNLSWIRNRNYQQAANQTLDSDPGWNHNKNW